MISDSGNIKANEKFLTNKLQARISKHDTLMDLPTSTKYRQDLAKEKIVDKYNEKAVSFH